MRIDNILFNFSVYAQSFMVISASFPFVKLSRDSRFTFNVSQILTPLT